MWLNKKKFKGLLNEIADVQARCQVLESQKKDIESEMKSLRQRKCPNKCTIPFRWTVIERPLTQVGKFYVCSECGYTEPYKEPKYTSLKGIRYGLEDLEEKVDELTSKLPKRAKRYKKHKKPAKKKVVKKRKK